MLTTYFLNRITEDIFKHQEMSTVPYEFYIGLSSTSPSIDGTGTTEPLPETGYKRVRVDNSILTFGEVAEDGTVSNHIPIYFPESLQPWNDISHYVIFDAPEAGELLMYGELDGILNVPIRTIVSVPASTLKISSDNGDL